MKKKKLLFKDLARSLTGFSTPVFGISWNPTEDRRKIVHGLITFLEDRRALFQDYFMEYGPWIVDSILEIRKQITDTLKLTADDPEIADPLRAMRSACRKFLDKTGAPSARGYRGYMHEAQMWTALGELRGIFGLHLARLCVAYGIDVEPELASIFPIPDDGKRGKN